MVAKPAIVIVGAGIVGCALADELTVRGLNRVTVLEQGPLFMTGGSTSHAPGLVFRTGSSPLMTRLAHATVEKYAGLPACFRRVGGLEVAATGERLADLRRRADRATAAGIVSELIDPAACAALHPLLDRERVLGGLHIPGDGLAVPLAAAEAQARAAMARGARFVDHTRVVDVEQARGRVTGVVTDAGTLPADVVVTCAGMWGPLVGAMAGVPIPLVPMAHQYARTTPLAELEAVEAVRRLTGPPRGLPMLRHQDADLYVRQHGDRLGIGAYGHRAMPTDPADLDRLDPGMRMPSERTFTPEDFEASWAAAADLLPALGEAKVDEGVNGVFSFTPDGLPLLGEHPELGGFWTAEAVWITHSAGVAEAVAEWIHRGRPAVGGQPIDLSAAHLDRFDPALLTPAGVQARACRAFDGVYDIVHPQAPGGPALRTTPFQPRHRGLGGVPAERDGWERPLWFGSGGDRPEVCEVPRRRGWAAEHHSPVADAEALRAARTVGLLDTTPRRRAELRGPAARGNLAHLLSVDVDIAVGTVVEGLALDRTGGLRARVRVARLGVDRYLLVTEGRLELGWLREHVLGDACLRDVTSATCALELRGPRAHDVLAAAGADGDRSARNLTFGEISLGRVPAVALPVGGGVELVTGVETGLALWDALVEAGEPYGLVAVGEHAATALRVARSEAVFGIDVGLGEDPVAAGLDGLVDLGKGLFMGRCGLLRAATPHRRTQAHRLVALALDDPGAAVLGGEPVLTAAGLGWVTTGTTGAALARVPAPVAEPGTAVHVRWFGDDLPAHVR